MSEQQKAVPLMDQRISMTIELRPIDVGELLELNKRLEPSMAPEEYLAKLINEVFSGRRFAMRKGWAADAAASEKSEVSK